MNIDNFKSAATRKIGPLPAWAWMLIAAVAVYYYRKRTAAATAATTAASTTTTATPDAGTVLTPGESIVNPDGTLTTAPGSDGSSSSDPNAGIEAELQPLITALTNQATANTGDSSPNTPTPVNIKITATLKKAASTVKKKAKPKKATTQPKGKTTAPHKSSSKPKPRLPAKVRNPLGGRTVSKTKGLGPNVEVRPRTVTPTKAAGTRLRARPVVALVGRTSVMQRPVATHPKATARPIIQSPPRPSAPAPRTQGRPITKPAPKPVKKRA